MLKKDNELNNSKRIIDLVGINLEEYFKRIREDFPILNQKINGNNLIYVDNAASAQKPKILIDGISNFYKNDYANIHRGVHTLSMRSSEKFENVRKRVANFINSNENEIIFTFGATDSLNKISRGLENYFNEGDEIIISVQEHHANLVIWQELSKKLNLNLKYVNIVENYDLDLEQLKKLLSKKTKLVSITHASNVTGTINDIEKISKLIKMNSNALFLVDASASIPHIKIDVKKLDIDFLVFSAHKLCGPSGVGIIYGKKEKLENILKPSVFGGDMIEDVYLKNSTFINSPEVFEAGTPNIEGVIGFGLVIDYLDRIGIENIIKWEEELMRYFLEKIKSLDNFILIGNKELVKRVPIFSFNIKGIHSHDVSSILDYYGIAIRAGHHCAMPLHNEILKINSTNRISFSFYNTKKEIDKIIEVLKNIKNIFEKGDYLLN